MASGEVGGCPVGLVSGPESILVECYQMYDVEQYRGRSLRLLCDMMAALQTHRSFERFSLQGQALPVSAYQFLVDTRSMLLDWTWEKEVVLPSAHGDVTPEFLVMHLSDKELLFRSWVLKGVWSWDAGSGGVNRLPNCIEAKDVGLESLMDRGKRLFNHLRSLECHLMPRSLLGLLCLTTSLCRTWPYARESDTETTVACCLRHTGFRWNLARVWLRKDWPVQDSQVTIFAHLYFALQLIILFQRTGLSCYRSA